MELNTHIENFLNSDLDHMFILSDLKELDLYLIGLGFEKMYSGNVYRKGKHKIIVEQKLSNNGEVFVGLMLFSVVITSKIIMDISTRDLIFLRSRVRGSLDQPKVFILDRRFDLKNPFEVSPV